MKFIVSRQELAALIRKIQNIVPQNAPLPILSHFLIEAAKGELIFTATDLTVGARCTVKAAKIFEEGSLSIPSKRFFQLIRELTDSTIEITSEEGVVAEIKAGSSRFRLHGMDKNEYPSLPDLAEATHFTISSEMLREVLYRTAFAVSKEDNRYELTGVFMCIQNKIAFFVGTDGKRLSRTETTVDLPADFSGEFILPLKAVDEILKLLPESKEATIYLTEDKIAVEVGDTLLISKLLTGKYPDFQQILATNSEITLTLHREELITLLKQVSLFTTDISQSVRFTFLPGELLLAANSADIGEGNVSMPVHYTGAKLDIAFNPHYFLDILRHSKDETVQLGISDPYNPGIITDSTKSRFILMPMRLSEV